MKTTLYRMTLFMIAVLLLAGCQAATAQPTLAPTVRVDLPNVVVEGPSEGEEVDPTAYPALAETPVAPGAEGYPAPGEATQAVVDPSESYPAEGYPGPAGVPAAENRSQVTARLVESAPDEANAGWVRLRAVILTSEEVNGMPSQTQDKINQEVDLYAESAGLPDLQPGDTFSALVSYQGDESGGRFTVSEVTK